jgi:hypothetical protein
MSDRGREQRCRVGDVVGGGISRGEWLMLAGQGSNSIVKP